MKKIITILLLSISVFSISHAIGGINEQSVIENIQKTDVVPYLYNNGLTKYSNFKDFNPNGSFTREQAAKFFSQFAINIKKKTKDEEKSCIFNDIKDADKTLVNNIIESCKLWIFQGSNWNFYPKQKLTKAETIAILIRTIVWRLDETKRTYTLLSNQQESFKRYNNYIYTATELDLIIDNWIDRDANWYYNRIDIWTMLYFAWKI